MDKKVKVNVKELTVLIYAILGIIAILGGVILYLGAMIGSDLSAFGSASIFIAVILAAYISTLDNKRGI